MAEESWHEARLIPTSGINGAEEQESAAPRPRCLQSWATSSPISRDET